MDDYMFCLVVPFDEVETCISVRQLEGYLRAALYIGWGLKVKRGTPARNKSSSIRESDWSNLGCNV